MTLHLSAATVESQSIVDVLTETCGTLLEDVRLFDVYRSEQLGEEEPCVRAEPRASRRTLSDAEVDEVLARAVEAVRERLGIEMRM